MKILKKCSISDCSELSQSKGLCKHHYNQYRSTLLTPEYRTWNCMKTRCYNPNKYNYKYWGGKGIKVCDEWKHDFQAFYNYVGKKPSPSHTIDRIDSNKDYEPGNVRWANKYEQTHNRSKKTDNSA